MHAFSVREALRAGGRRLRAARAGRSTWAARRLRRPSTGRSRRRRAADAGAADTASAPDRSGAARESDVDWLSAVAAAAAGRRRPGCSSRSIEVRGHAPRDAGAKMVVGADHTWGSVGGGNLEETAVRRAREMIAAGAVAPETLESRLNEHARNPHGRQCCGGEVDCCSSRCRPDRRSRLRRRSRRLRAGQDPVPAGDPAAPGRLPRRAARSAAAGRASPTEPPTSPCTTRCSASRCSSGCRAARTS